MKRPFGFIIIPLIIGIVVSYYFQIDLILLFSIIILLIVMIIINLFRSNDSPLLFFLLFLFLGMILTSYTLNNSKLIKSVNKDVTIFGIIDEVIEKGEDQGKYIVKVNLIEDGSASTKVNEKTVLKVIGSGDCDIGHNIKFNGKLNIPNENTNPKLFNYRLNLLSNKIYTTVTIRDYSILDINRGSISFKYRLRSNFVNRIEKVFDNNLREKNSSLMKSIILGEYSYLDDESVLRYRDLGLAHILAVSGLHIGIIAGFIIYLLANIGVKRKYNIIITLGIIWSYGFLIGFPPSLLRANIMFSIFFYSQLLAEPYDRINTLSFAAFILLLINPLWVFNLGFQLSFLATFSIIYLSPKIGQFFYPLRNKSVYTLSGLLAVQVGLLPLQAYYFNKISILSIIANLLIAPILSLGLIIGGVMIGLSYTIPILNPLMGKILDLLLLFQDYLVGILFNLPWGIMKIHSPNIGEIIIYYVVILMLVGVLRLEKLKIKIKKLIFYYMIVFLVYNFIGAMNDKSLEIHFIDVGQGDSILLKTNRWNYLIDTGGNIMDTFDVGQNITLPYLEKLGVKNLRGVFITHFHDDHCKSLPLLMDNININNILVSYEEDENEIYKSIIEKDIPIKILEEGDLINLDRDISLEVLSPNESMGHRGFSPNNLSLVFLISYYDKNILFTGDMEKEAEWEIVEKLNKPIDIIKVPHHGSNTSSTEGLLNKIKPEIGVISVGRNNFYGHPVGEIIERYENIDTKLYRTDEDGMVKLRLNKKDVSIESFIKETPKLINLLFEHLLIISFYAIYYITLYILTKIFVNLEEELVVNELY